MTPDTQPVTTHSDPTDSSSSPRRTRRILTPEQRIANREAEIERIKEVQRQNLARAVEKAALDLDALCQRALAMKDDRTAQRCRAAFDVLMEAAIEPGD